MQYRKDFIKNTYFTTKLHLYLKKKSSQNYILVWVHPDLKTSTNQSIFLQM